VLALHRGGNTVLGSIYVRRFRLDEPESTTLFRGMFRGDGEEGLSDD
jgi:hypothetical protein